jgi:hypothetical protein
MQFPKLLTNSEVSVRFSIGSRYRSAIYSPARKVTSYSGRKTTSRFVVADGKLIG